MINQRADPYGQGIEGRNLLAIEIARATAEAIGGCETGLPDRSILAGGFDKKRAEAALLANRGDLVAFARSFLANPDLIERMQQDAMLNEPDAATFYTPGAQGYTDYPTLAAT
jgi:N-ethylmaleimide reductase